MLATPSESQIMSDTYAMVENISQRVQGMTVRIRRGKYEGRIAELAGAIMGWDGRISYLCYVQRADGSGPINGDAASRSYLPDDWFDIVEDEEGGY